MNEQNEVDAIDMSSFVDTFAVFGKGIGLPPSAAHILGYLLVCTPRHQSLLDIQKTLSMSSGTVSQAMNILTQISITEKIRLPADRKHYFQLTEKGFAKIIEKRLQSLSTMEDIAKYGLLIDPENDRLIEMRDLYSFLDREFRDVLQKLRVSTLI